MDLPFDMPMVLNDAGTIGYSRSTARASPPPNRS